MTRHLVPTTNVSFNSHLEPAFETYSLNTMGGLCYPVRTSGGTQVDEFNTGDYFIRMGPIQVYDGDASRPLFNDGGKVRYSSPFTTSYDWTVDAINLGYVIDRSVYSTITLQHDDTQGNPGGYFFIGWYTPTLGLISTSNPATLSLSLTSVYNSSEILAVVFL